MELNEEIDYNELKAIHERQSKLVKNSKFLYKLPDKGRKLFESHKKIQEMLHQHRGKISTASLPDLFSELTVKTSSNEIIDINQIEWTGATSGKITCSHDNGDKNSVKETDDDHIIKLLATTNHLSKIVIDERVNSRRCTDRTFKPFHTRKYKIYENGTTVGEMNAATLPVEKYDHPVVNPMNESLEIQT